MKHMSGWIHCSDSDLYFLHVEAAEGHDHLGPEGIQSGFICTVCFDFTYPPPYFFLHLALVSLGSIHTEILYTSLPGDNDPVLQNKLSALRDFNSIQCNLGNREDMSVLRTSIQNQDLTWDRASVTFCGEK